MRNIINVIRKNYFMKEILAQRFFTPKSFWFSPVSSGYARRKLGYTNIREFASDWLLWAGYTYKYILASFVSKEEGIPYQLVYASTFRTCTPFRGSDWLCNLLRNNPDVIFLVSDTKKQVLRRFELQPELR
jgi:hypothetical protein